MYKVFCEDLNEIKYRSKNLNKAIKEAIEWAEYDDICMIVIDQNNNEVFKVDGYGPAAELMIMQEESN